MTGTHEENSKIPSYRSNLACKTAPFALKEAKANSIRSTLLFSLIYVESGWDKKAISKDNACGLTQVVPKWTGWKVPKLTCKQLHDPKTSIKTGAKLLKYWIYVYGKGDERVGLCGYNKGFRCKGKKPNKRGMMYAKKVLKVEQNLIKAVYTEKLNER